MNSLELSMAVLFYPVDAFNYVKSRKQPINYFFCMLLLYAMVIVRIAAIYIVHFPIASTHPRDANIWLETAKMLVPVLSWVVACYAISSISDGETLIGETFAAASYAIIPYIVFSIPLMFFSRIMGRSLLLLYDSLNAIMWLWVILVVFISVKTLNDYTLWQTTKVCVMSIIAMLILWAVLLLLFALTCQLIQFVWGLILEIRMIFMK